MFEYCPGPTAATLDYGPPPSGGGYQTQLVFCSKGKVGSEDMEDEPSVNRHQMVAVGMLLPTASRLPRPQGPVMLAARNLQGRHASPG